MIYIDESCESERLEEFTDICDQVLDQLICDIFGVAPLSEDKRTVEQNFYEIINESADMASERKNIFRIFDENPSASFSLHFSLPHSKPVL